MSNARLRIGAAVPLRAAAPPTAPSLAALLEIGSAMVYTVYK